VPATSVAVRRAMAIAEHHPSALFARNRGLLKMTHRQLHDFAATPERGLPQHAGDRKMAEKPEKHWMEKAFAKKQGSMTRMAKRAGQSTRSFAISHYHAKGAAGRKARAAVNANPSWRDAV
jgi:hypothetical protein